MATNRQSSVQDKIADVTECSICTEVYANPKILPCVHTFCFRCLEKYGRDKKPGDQMACPICRNEFLVPDGGFSSLPNNFFIYKMVEIRKLSEASTNETLCATCPVEEGMKAEMFCFECEQNFCRRCGISHRKIKQCQNHQVVDIGKNLKPQDVNFRNSYCDQHPGELVKMYCEDDKATICFLCFAESHQTHKCLSVTKASEEFSCAFENNLKTIRGKLSEFKACLEKLDMWKTELLVNIAEAEKQISNEAARLNALIETHANVLTQKLTVLKDTNMKKLESMKQDVERYQVIIESYANYSEELLSKGAPGDICREADHLKARACELASLTTNFCARDFNGDGVIFKSLNLDNVLHMNNIANVIGDVQVGSMNDRLVPTVTNDTVIRDVMPSQQISQITAVKMQPNNLMLNVDSDVGFSASTKSEIPTSVIFPFDVKAVHFIQRHPELQKYIEDCLKKLNCHVTWPSEGKGEAKLEFRGEDKQKPTAGWDTKCEKVIQMYADELTWKKENILQELWNDFKQKIKEETAKKSKLLDVAFENDQCEIQYIGLKKDTDEFEKIFRKIKGELKEELAQRKTRISESVTNFKPHLLSLIGTEQFQRELKHEFPKVDFEMKTTEVNLYGMPDAVKRAKLFLYEKVAAFAQDSFEISELMTKVFAKDEARPYLKEQLLSKGISASWTCNNKRVVVFALKDQHLKKAVEILKNEVAEVPFHLNSQHEEFVQLRSWKDFIRRLCEEDKLLEIGVYRSLIVVACMRSSIHQITERIEGFFAKSRLPLTKYP